MARERQQWDDGSENRLRMRSFHVLAELHLADGITLPAGLTIGGVESSTVSSGLNEQAARRSFRISLSADQLRDAGLDPGRLSELEIDISEFVESGAFRVETA